jgi:hypothetical protein
MNGDEKVMAITLPVLFVCFSLVAAFGIKSCRGHNMDEFSTIKHLTDKGLSGAEINCAMNSYETTTCFVDSDKKDNEL